MFKKGNYRGIRTIAAVVILAVLAVIFAVAEKTGVKAELSANAVSIKSAMFRETVSYADIADIRLLDNIDYGRRDFGVGIPGLNTGNFSNSEFGAYKCAVTTSASMCIAVKKTDGSYVVFNRKTNEETESLYNQLRDKVTQLAGKTAGS